MQVDLQGMRVLIVEDEAIIGMYTDDTLTDAGAIVIGPVAKLSDAFEALNSTDRVDSVALDLNLHGESSAAFADELARRNIPFVFLTGYDAGGIPEAHRHRPIINKPYDPTILVAAFAALQAGSAPTGADDAR